MKDWKDTILKGEMRIVLFVSRNKDNKETIPNFKERTVRFLTTLPIEEIEKQFDFFVNYGLPNEFSRYYISLNERDNKKTQKRLIHKLIDEDVNLTSLPSIAVSIAAKKENSAGKQWFFDFDSQDETLLAEFVSDVERESSQYKNSEPIEILTQKTVNGYAVIISHGFDTRNLLKKWSDVELKRDDYICCFWKYKK
mgnify:CR=1 FL=1